MEQEAFTPRDIERIYRLNRGVLAHWRCTGQGPRYVKAGSRKVLYLRADVESWLQENAVETGAGAKG
jgi:predicted DNA-binding transcriptional regulator AlpA